MWHLSFLQASFVLLLFGCLSLLWLKKWVSSHEKRFPPGPFALPVLGHIHLLGHLPHQNLAQLCARYGDMMGMRLGQQLCVVVSSPELAKEFLVRHDTVFSSRLPYQFASVVAYGIPNDIFFCGYGSSSTKFRKICTLQLFSSKRHQELEYLRQEEVEALLQRITQLSGEGMTAVDIGRCVGEMSANLICRLLFSTTSTEAEEGENLRQLMKETEQETAPTLGDFIPWFSWPFVLRKRRMRRLHKRIDNLITRILISRKQAMIESNAPQDDFLHALLSRQVTGAAQDDDTLTTDEIKGIILGMLGASIQTTPLTLEWVMAELLKNPDCLVKLQREMDMVIGDNKKWLSDADVGKLSYLKCVVKEAFRLHPVVPLLQRYNTSGEECKVGDYTLPARTQMLLNVWAIGRDVRIWRNAEQFMPERFEGKDTDLKGQHFELLPFGAGRRICVGLPLGLSVVEVTLANLVNRFNWELPSGASMSMEEKPGITSKRAAPVVALPTLRA